MLFNDMCNNLHKKNANYRKKCIFLVQTGIYFKEFILPK